MGRKFYFKSNVDVSTQIGKVTANLTYLVLTLKPEHTC